MGPWAALGAVLAVVASRVGPHVVLPPQIGGVASLNLFVGLVGPSSAGKDAALTTALDFLWSDVPRHALGTGQGIDSAYTEQTKDGPMQFCDTALFTATEIDSIRAHAQMAGSNLLATLRDTYNAAALGARYANKEKRRPVKAHHYRLALVAGIQPQRSKVLLDDMYAGTPQRWLWLPTNDPDAPDQPPPEPLPLDWTVPDALAAQGESFLLLPERIVLSVCQASIDEVHQARLAQLRNGMHATIDGHALLTQRKVAVLLSLLDGRAEVRDDDWNLAREVMAVSMRTRDMCIAAVRSLNQEETQRRAGEKVELDALVDQRQLESLSERVLALLPAQGVVTVRHLGQRMNGRHRALLGEVLARLQETGLIKVEGRNVYRA